MPVYVIGGASGPVKIGYAADPWRRIQKMQSDNRDALRLLALVEGDLGTEAGLHARFAGARIRGEWFARSPDIEAFIAANRAGERPRRSRGRPKSVGAATDNRVMELRLDRGMTQTQLGNAVRRDSTWVFKVETGRRALSWNNAVNLAEVFGVDPRDLFVVSPLAWVPWGTPDAFGVAA